MALVASASYLLSEPSADPFTYSYIVPLTSGDYTDVFAPAGTQLLVMFLAWEGDVTLSTIYTSAATRATAFMVCDWGADYLSFLQVILQSTDGVGLRILDTSGGSQDITIQARVISK